MNRELKPALAAPSQERVTDYKARYEYLLHHMGLVEAHARTWNPARHKPLMAYLEDFIIAALRAKGGK